ncbi:MAG: WD40 repeat protein [bacterium]|jgi:WD40 repeat protein
MIEKETFSLPEIEKVISIETVSELKALKQIGYGELTGAKWISDTLLVFCTTSGVFTQDLKTEEYRTLYSGNVTNLFISQDKKKIALVIKNIETVILSVENGSVVTKLGQHLGGDNGKQVFPIASLEFSFDGKLIASVGRDLKLRVYSVEDGKEIFSCKHKEDCPMGPTVLSWSSDGQKIATLDDYYVYIWSIQGKKLLEFSGYYTKTLQFSPDNLYLLAYQTDGNNLQVYSIDGIVNHPVSKSLAEYGDIKCTNFSSDNKLFASGNGRQGKANISIFDTSNWQVTKNLTQEDLSIHEDSSLQKDFCICSLNFSPDGKSLLICTSNQSYSERRYHITLQVWNVERWEREYCLMNFASTVQGMGLSNDNNLLALGTNDGVKTLDLNTKEVRIYNPLTVDALTLSSDGERIYLSTDQGYDGNKVFNFKTKNGEEELEFLSTASSSTIRGLTLSEDEEFFATLVNVYKIMTQPSQTIKIWKKGRKTALKNITGGKELEHINFSPSGNLLASTSYEGFIQLWQAPKFCTSIRLELQRKNFKYPVKYNKTAFSSDETMIAVSATQGLVDVWNIEKKEVITTLTINNEKSSLQTVAFSPNGKLLVASNFDGQIFFWNIETSQLLVTINAHCDRITNLIFSSDEKFLYSSSEDGTTKVWGIFE